MVLSKAMDWGLHVDWIEPHVVAQDVAAFAKTQPVEGGSGQPISLQQHILISELDAGDEHDEVVFPNEQTPSLPIEGFDELVAGS